MASRASDLHATIQKYPLMGWLGGNRGGRLNATEEAMGAELHSESDGSDLGMLLSSFFPGELRDRFKDAEKLGSGSFGTTFLAKDSSTGEMVAVKVLSNGAGSWLTSGMANDETMRMLIDESKEECVKTQRIHLNAQVDPKGGEHVVKCLEDGITQALEDPTKMNQPLYVVMDFVGDNEMDWWEKLLGKWQDNEISSKEMSRHLRSVSRDMMLGLRFMTHKDAPEKWVHHDLKPPNMAVLHKDDDTDPKLTIIDLGTVVSEKMPQTKKVICTPIFQPPELAGAANSVGYSLPIHSFDASSASLTMLGMAGNPEQQGGPSPLPIFYAAARGLGMSNAMRINTLSDIAACITELNGYRRDNFTRWVQIYEECLQREGISKYVGLAAEEMLDKVRKTKTRSTRTKELTALIACNQLDPTARRTTRELTHQIVTEWVTTGFDKVLLKMLELDPEKRPAPQEVLEAEWFKEGYMAHNVDGSSPNITCDNIQAMALKSMVPNVLIPVGLIVVSSSFAECCCLLGCCCHFAGKVPSPAFTAAIAGMFVFASAGVSTVWVSHAVAGFLVCISFLIAPCLCFTGCTSARRTPSSSSSAWTMSLFMAGFYFLILFCAMRWLSDPIVDMLGFIDEHHEEFVSEQNELEVGFIPSRQHLAAMKVCVWFTFLPPFFGMVTASFGLWRENVHGRARPAPTMQGTELPTRVVAAPVAPGVVAPGVVVVSGP